MAEQGVSAPQAELDEPPQPALKTRREDDIRHESAVIVQMFEWNWDSVAEECKNFIGPAGYAYVQVSPPQESIQGGQWWTDYQPVSYKLQSKRGSRAQFERMVDACHSAGVKVLADTLFNHMTAKDSGVGTAGSSFTHYNYPGVYTPDDFHHCNSPGGQIQDYNNEYQVQNCELLGLADLKTESEKVRATLAAYANDLVSLGVDGFRLDAAKHIPNADIQNILSRLTTKPAYVTQETQFASGHINPSDYIGNGDAQEFNYPVTLKNAFLGNGATISQLKDLSSRSGWLPSGSANVFVANHDTERSGLSLDHSSPSNTYANAHVFSLAYPYGHPTVLSGYAFSSFDDDAPTGGAGMCSAHGGMSGWLCQHRWPQMAGMVGFRKNVGDAPMTDWVSPANDRIAFGRGNFGFVAINNDDAAWPATFVTSLPNGKFCEVSAVGVHAVTSEESCGGVSVVVNDGSFSATVPPRGAFAIHTGAQLR
ncbi:glycoside hydrolase family 13 protein [Fistulina hepatica ATCC 64428]|uniref:Alpha-amylase n=1 Tax=Fistulina hepatica ATCC 64428 TaxID=1128425 RepID=A0A0D7A7V0_9AGAR|nr:glycoside hydrolase family 13 protein [Fistulina hepatica ATCC 64428]